MENLLVLKDKNNNTLHEDDILHNGKDYYRINTNGNGEFELLSSTRGYIHNVQPKDLKEFTKAGTVKDNIELLSNN